MIGPTGIGKNRDLRAAWPSSRRPPFLKVEATKFTEVGYVGRDVESIIRDLVEVAINLTREKMREDVKDDAHIAAENRVIEALVGENAGRDDARELSAQAQGRAARRQRNRDRRRRRKQPVSDVRNARRRRPNGAAWGEWAA